MQYAELGPVHRGRSPHGARDDDTDLMVPEPRGVVAVLTPWNDPVAVAAGLLGAALATGNTVVHKPSERCPQTGRRFAALTAQAQQWAEGIGPLVDRGHRRHVHGHVEGALDVGAHALTGGTIPDGPGAFCPPTVLIGCVPDMAVVSEETFGPVAPVRVVPDFTTALREASADRDGLAATVLTPDMAHAQAAWRELPVGTVKINDVFRGSGSGFGPELLDEMSVVKVVHLAPASRPS